MRPGKRGKSLRMKMYWMTRLKAWTLRRNAELTCGDACHMSLKVVCTTLTTQRGSTGKNNFQFPDPAWKWHSNKHFSGSWWEFDQCVVWVGVSVEMGPLAVRCLTHGSPPLHSLSLSAARAPDIWRQQATTARSPANMSALFAARYNMS